MSQHGSVKEARRLLLLAALAAAVMPRCEAHGYLENPQARNKVKYTGARGDGRRLGFAPSLPFVVDLALPAGRQCCHSLSTAVASFELLLAGS